MQTAYVPAVSENQIYDQIATKLLRRVGPNPTPQKVADEWSLVSVLAEREFSAQLGKLFVPDFGKTVEAVALQNTALCGVFCKANALMQAEHENENEGPTIEFINGREEPEKAPPPRGRR